MTWADEAAGTLGDACADAFHQRLPMCLAFHIGSMYGIFTSFGWVFMVNVGKYTIHGWYGFQFRCI